MEKMFLRIAENNKYFQYDKEQFTINVACNIFN
jgi:hypothetical protein